jgi:phenylpyruvate tautomerase PptA (4-oxalocrotonate tautomerase family)
MPHVVVKLYSGRSEQQKALLAEALTRAVTGCITAERLIALRRRR